MRKRRSASGCWVPYLSDSCLIVCLKEMGSYFSAYLPTRYFCVCIRPTQADEKLDRLLFYYFESVCLHLRLWNFYARIPGGWLVGFEVDVGTSSRVPLLRCAASLQEEVQVQEGQISDCSSRLLQARFLRLPKYAHRHRPLPSPRHRHTPCVSCHALCVRQTSILVMLLSQT